MPPKCKCAANEPLVIYLESDLPDLNENGIRNATKAAREIRKYMAPITSFDEFQRVKFVGTFLLNRMKPFFLQHIQQFKNDGATPHAVPITEAPPTVPVPPATVPALPKPKVSRKRKAPETLSNDVAVVETNRDSDNIDIDTMIHSDEVKAASVRPSRSYTPKPNSAAAAILVALLNLSESDSKGSNKSDIIHIAKNYTNVAFETVGAVSSVKKWYNGWSSMSNLVVKDLVKKIGRKFCLTVSGRAVAEIARVNAVVVVNSNPSTVELSTRPSMSMLERLGFGDVGRGGESECEGSDGSELSDDASKYIHSFDENNFNRMQIPIDCIKPMNYPEASSEQDMFCHHFNIILVWDTRESKGKEFENLLRSKDRDLVCRSHCLCVGDYLWLAQRKCDHEEFVLDYIVERKEVGDLAGSIASKRFHEQKYYMQRCGVAVPIYLVHGPVQDGLSVTASAIETAMMQMQIDDNIIVVHKATTDKAIDWISITTKLLRSLMSNISIRSFLKNRKTFQQFIANGILLKSLPVVILLARQIAEINGINSEAAEAIANRFKTTRQIIQELNDNTKTESERINLIATIGYGNPRRFLTIGKATSIYKFYTA